MSISDGLNYIFVSNPVSEKLIGGTAWLLRGGKSAGVNSALKNGAKNMSQSTKVACWPPINALAGRSQYLVRLAGLSGATAVILGAIGAHKLNPSIDAESRTIFDTANRFHFFHSLALMGTPFARFPILTGALILSGTALFSGLLYYRAFTGDKTYAHLAPIGGTCLIVAWLSFIL